MSAGDQDELPANAALLTQPFSAAVSALLYTDARIRAEGFDLALARAVSGAPVGL